MKPSENANSHKKEVLAALWETIDLKALANELGVDLSVLFEPEEQKAAMYFEEVLNSIRTHYKKQVHQLKEETPYLQDGRPVTSVPLEAVLNTLNEKGNYDMLLNFLDTTGYLMEFSKISRIILSLRAERQVSEKIQTWIPFFNYIAKKFVLADKCGRKENEKTNGSVHWKAVDSYEKMAEFLGLVVHNFLSENKQYKKLLIWAKENCCNKKLPVEKWYPLMRDFLPDYPKYPALSPIRKFCHTAFSYILVRETRAVVLFSAYFKSKNGIRFLTDWAKENIDLLKQNGQTLKAFQFFLGLAFDGNLPLTLKKYIPDETGVIPFLAEIPANNSAKLVTKHTRENVFRVATPRVAPIVAEKSISPRTASVPETPILKPEVEVCGSRIRVLNLNEKPKNAKCWVRVSGKPWEQITLDENGVMDLSSWEKTGRLNLFFRFAPTADAPKDKFPEVGFCLEPQKRERKTNTPLVNTQGFASRVKSVVVSPMPAKNQPPVEKLIDVSMEPTIPSPIKKPETENKLEPLLVCCRYQLQKFRRFSVNQNDENSWWQEHGTRKDFWWNHVVRNLSDAAIKSRILEKLQAVFLPFDITIEIIKIANPGHGPFKLKILWGKIHFFAEFDKDGNFKIETAKPEEGENEKVKVVGNGILACFANICAGIGNFPPRERLKNSKEGEKLKQQVIKKVKENRPVFKAEFDKEGYFLKKTPVFPSDLNEEDTLVLRDALFLFSQSELPHADKLKNGFLFSEQVYDKVREELGKERNLKYLVKRIISTVKFHKNMPLSEEDREPVKNPKTWEILQELLQELEIYFEFFYDKDFSISDLLSSGDENHPWPVEFIDRLRKSQIPIGYSSPILYEYADLKQEMQREEII